MGTCNVQDEILSEMKKSKVLVTVYLINGLQIKGTVIDFDESVILLEYEEKQQMLYKHSVMIARPMKRLNFTL